MSGSTTKPGFLARHRIVRSSIKEDLLQFALPAIVVFGAGLVVSGTTGWRGLAATVGRWLRAPESASPSLVWETAGLSMVIIGFALAFVAVGTLRMSYLGTLAIRKGQRLVTHGIYRVVRHPIYLGVLLVCVGLAVHAASVPGVVTMSVLIPLFLNRIRLEERLLIDEFGEAYRTYRETTSKLVPWLY